MIKQNEFGLGGFKLIESSEQGMLAAVERAVRDKKPVVFLGWAPHPMNTHFNMRYLTGGDDNLRPGFRRGDRAAPCTRQGYAQQCPNVGRLLANIEFNVELENEWMDAILGKQVRVTDLARDWVVAAARADAALARRRARVRWPSRDRSACGDGTGPFNLERSRAGSRPARFRSATR